jgi:arylsulfatase A-like enzyme
LIETHLGILQFFDGMPNENTVQPAYDNLGFGATTTLGGPIPIPTFDRWPTHQGLEKFYGFFGGETDQLAPLIYNGVKKIKPPRKGNDPFTEDMTNQVANWIKAQQSMTPDKPFFVYFSTGK